MKFLCKYLGGSHAYGLNTETSDLDYRGVFCNTDISRVIGLDRFEHQTVKAETEDGFFYEARHFMCLLRKTNTMVIETLYNKNWEIITPEFQRIIDNKEQLIDSDKFYKSLRGYLHNERRLAIGERTGKTGFKRKIAIEELGFSPKNFTNALRLCFAGRIFFEKGYFAVNIREESYNRWDYFMELRLKPENFTKETLLKELDVHEALLDNSYGDTKIHYRFNEKLANNILLDTYYPIIQNLKYERNN